MTAALPLLTTFGRQRSLGLLCAGHPAPTGLEDARYSAILPPTPIRCGTEAWAAVWRQAQDARRQGRSEMKIGYDTLVLRGSEKRSLSIFQKSDGVSALHASGVCCRAPYPDENWRRWRWCATAMLAGAGTNTR